MTARVLLGIGQEELRSQTMATFAELGDDVDVLGVAETSSDLLLAVDATQDLDIVVVHDQIGTLPYLALVREIVTRSPDTAVMVMTGSPTLATYQAVMDVGGRAIIDAPPSHDELTARLPGILDWQRQLRAISGPPLGLSGADQAGRLIAFTGAKGGVGTSTIALHAALLAAVSNPERRICLIDLDLQQRGLRQMFDISAKRTIVDLVTISDALTGRNLDEAVIVHKSGLRVLMSPQQGEQSEDVSGPVARQIIGAAKGHFDLIIVDAGSVVTEASAVGMEFADALVMVATPDVSCIRAVQDKLDMLNRLQVAKSGDVQLLFNKVSPRNEVQPEFGARMTSAEPMSASVPEDWRKLEPAANAMAPLDLEDGPFRRAVLALGRELNLALPAAAPAPMAAAPRGRSRSKPRRRRGDEDGQVTIEAVVGIVVAMLILLLLMQTTLLAIATVSSRRAADEAARTAVRGGTVSEVQDAASDAVPGFYDVEVTKIDETTYKATLEGPTLFPLINRPIAADGSASEEGS